MSNYPVCRPKPGQKVNCRKGSAIDEWWCSSRPQSNQLQCMPASLLSEPTELGNHLHVLETRIHHPFSIDHGPRSSLPLLFLFYSDSVNTAQSNTSKGKVRKVNTSCFADAPLCVSGFCADGPACSWCDNWQHGMYTDRSTSWYVYARNVFFL